MGANNYKLKKNIVHRGLSECSRTIYDRNFDGYLIDDNLENSEKGDYSKNIKNLEEKKLEEKCKKEIEDLEKEKEINEKKENNGKFEETNESLLSNERTGKYKKLKILSIIFYNLVLIFICLYLFYFYFCHSGNKQKGSIECIYIYPGNEIDILNPNYIYDKDILQIFINDKEINKNEKFKSNNTESFNVTIKLFSDSIDLSDMFTSQSVKTVIMRSQSSIKIKNMRNVFKNCTFLEKFEINGFDSSQVKSMSNLFYNTKNLKKVNINTLETSSLEDMDYMFAFTNLPEINLTKFGLDKILKSKDIFKDIKTSKVIINKKFENQKESLREIYPNINFEFQN